MNTNIRLLFLSVALTFFAGGAEAGIIPINSSLVFGGTDLPGACANTTCSDAVTFSSTPVLIDGGALSLYETQVADGANAEWDVWHVSTTDGGSLAGDVNGEWSITMSYDLSQPVFLDGIDLQWTVDGTPVSPISNFGICCVTASGPILSGASYYYDELSYSRAAGVQSDWHLTSVPHYSLISAGGIDPATANGFNFALHFTLQNPTTGAPEPGTLPLLGGGLLGFFAMAFRRRVAPSRGN